ncbi:hypothetical protein PMIN06_002688 [Paraphaeosphaeria minitans]
MMDRAREAAHAATPNAVAFPLPPTGIVHISESTLTTFPRPCRPANQCLIGADVPSAPRQTVFFKARTFRFTVPTPSILLSYDNAPTLLSYNIASTLLCYNITSTLLSYNNASTLLYSPMTSPLLYSPMTPLLFYFPMTSLGGATVALPQCKHLTTDR